MVNSSWWCAFLIVLLLVGGAGSVRAIEYDEMVQQHGEWVFRSTEDPVLKLTRGKGVITNERYIEVLGQKGRNWIEPADAILNRRQDLE